jgi:hypothetical protein
MTSQFVATTLVAALTMAAPNFAFANGRHHRPHPVALWGYGSPTCRDLNRSYLPDGHDPDPELNAALRRDYKSGMIDFPGIGR